MDSLQSAHTAVIGAGSWGTALAIQIARQGHPVRLWGRDRHAMAAMAASHFNQRYLPDIPLPRLLYPTADMREATAAAAAVLMVVPSHVFLQTLNLLSPFIPASTPIAWATKGVLPNGGRLLHEVVAELRGERQPMAVISGPTFAMEVAMGLPTAVTIAASSPEVADHFVSILHGKSFRAYTSDDIVSVEIGGASKNVLAIAAGIADGLGFGANARTALITRGLAELMRLGVALGGRSETLMGLSGLGDLLLTSTDNQSRNRRVGIGLGEGRTLDEVIEEIGQAVEGVDNAAEIYAIARRLGVETPIIDQVYRVLHQGLSPEAAVQSLLQRSPKAESETAA